MSEPTHWRELAKTLRVRVLAELRGSPSLYKEYKRLRGSPWRGTLAGIFLLAFLALALGVAIGSAQERAFLFLWVFWTICAAACVFMQAGSLRTFLERERERLCHLPLTDRFLFDLALERSRGELRAYTAFFAYLAALGVLSLPLGSGPAHIIALCALVPVQVATVHVFGLMTLRWCPKKLSNWGGCGFLLLSLLVFAPLMWAAGPMGQALDWLGAHREALLVLPVAWAPHGVLGLVEGRPLELLWGLPLAAALLATPAVLGGLRRQPWTALPEEPPPEEQAEDPSDAELEDVVDQVKGGVWLTGWGPAPRDWLNRAILLVLTPREQLLYRVLQPEPRWSRRIVWGLGVLAVAVLLPSLFPGLPEPFVVLPALLSMLGLPIIDEWSGLQPVKAEGGWIPRFAFYPMGQRELARVMLKVSAVRAVFFLVPAVVLGAFMALSLGWTFLEGGSLSTRIAVAFLGLLPAVVTAHFAFVLSGDRIRFRTLFVALFWVIALTTGAVLMLSAPGAAVVRPGAGGLEFLPRLEVLIGGGLLWALGWGTYWLYPWFFRRTDLIRVLPPESAALHELQEKERRNKLRKGK